VVDAGALPELVDALSGTHAATQHAAAWAVLHMAMHGASICDALVGAGVLPPLLRVYISSAEGAERHVTAKAALKEVTTRCTILAPMLALIGLEVPSEVAAHALRAAHRVLQNSVAARRDFVTCGALMTLQRLEAAMDDKGKESVAAINGLFPTDVVKYYRQDMAQESAARSAIPVGAGCA
jgi:Armadillo/beta-catenin-like repeat